MTRSSSSAPAAGLSEAARPAKRERRRRLFVDRRIQLAFLWRDLKLALFALICLSAGLMAPLFLQLDPALGATGDPKAASAFLHLHSMLWPALMVVCAVVALVSLRTSHRIAGPLYRIRKHLKLVELGEDPGVLRLRNGDYFAPEAEQLNATLDAMNQRGDNGRDRLRGMLETLASGNEFPEELRAQARRLGADLATWNPAKPPKA